MNMITIREVTGGGEKYTWECVSAISECDNQLEEKRQFALLVTCEYMETGEKEQHVVFGFEPPCTIEDFINMSEDYSAWEPLEEFHRIKFLKR